MIHKVFQHGEIELKNPANEDTFKVNGQRVKSYLQKGRETGLIRFVLPEKMDDRRAMRR